MASSDAPGAVAGARPTPTSRAASRLAWSLVAVAIALAGTGWLLSSPVGDSDFGHVLLYDVMWAVVLVAWGIVGALIAGRQPRNPIGWILVLLTLYAALTAVAEGYLDRYLAGAGGARQWAEASAWLVNWAWIPLVTVPLTMLPLYFPHGRLPSRRWRIVPWCAAAGTACFAVSEAFAPGPLHDYPEVVNPYGIDNPVIDALGLGSLLLLGAAVASVASVVVRFRRATGVERQQIKWIAYAGCVAIGILVPASVIGGLWSEDIANALIIAGIVGLTGAIGIAILRHRIYDIDLLINRTLVYGGLTIGVVGVYVALVGGLSTFIHESADVWLALVATGLAAVLVQPLRSALQRRVNRLVPREPSRGSRGLRGRLHGAFVPEAAELQRARERLVTAREEERRRLRRDLHDGLGPALAGAALKIEAAENLLRSDTTATSTLLRQARAEIQDAVSGVRRLVYDLRPPALDELGLVGALEEQAARLSGAGDTALQLDVTAPDGLNGLPAAVEVAAFRIALEAMTNAVRHAQAQRCSVRITENGALELEISDDGTGLASDFRPGVGIGSMHERAEELGGTCVIERNETGGTRIRARLPLGPP